ncbi:hypothetical protein SARC_03776 [Sphaeroforma arctica JP610]|uniref:Uncharacterized protein n=1 Tax=Sphaeroforma arctica JP610 TaxID=667725 RepID=A0A0L0G6Y0_9EUKA|nr:hypothetical protein SARC_03776 [Sphaeroforma arctica JP610]KNC83988.1 hypothetical protein SARC_03776 [Sphaeroforma arctica JP610]|eukprot:XP_014157890.1 hypothetical protein SARC_03776 [Sphaeroforma arctica JP610]
MTASYGAVTEIITRVPTALGSRRKNVGTREGHSGRRCSYTLSPKHTAQTQTDRTKNSDKVIGQGRANSEQHEAHETGIFNQSSPIPGATPTYPTL